MLTTGATIRRSVPTTSPIKALDFFCGAGGLTRGLLDAGIRVLAGVDNDERLAATYESNNQPAVFVDEDVRAIDIRALRRRVGIRREDLVLYAACTPCQPFSTLNQKRGVDDRKSLLLAFARLVKIAPPDFLLVENVPGLGNAYGREVYERFVDALDQVGLVHRASDLIDAKDFGVPQVRKRFVMLASRRGPISLPRKSRGDPRTVRWAIQSLPPPVVGIEGGHSRSAPSARSSEARLERRIPNHVARALSPKHRAIVRAVPRDGGSRSDIKDLGILLACHKRAPNLHKDVFGRMSWDAPAPTLTCRCTDVYCGRFVHPSKDRGLSLREAALIQTFPRQYVFHGTFFHAASQIGNAVPVLLARKLGQSVIRASAQADAT